jgi:hypothetical protein
MYNVVKYNLESNNVAYEDENIKLSNFMPESLKEIIETIPDDHYILGVQYDVKNDIQVGITGTSHIKENWKRTVTREMAEELKLYPKFEEIEDSKITSDEKKTWFCCKINVDKTLPSLNQTFKQEIPKKNCRKKIGVVVYGEFEKLYELLENNYEKYIPNDNITHIVMIKVELVKKYINNFTFKGCGHFIT